MPDRAFLSTPLVCVPCVFVCVCVDLSQWTFRTTVGTETTNTAALMAAFQVSACVVVWALIYVGWVVCASGVRLIYER